MFDHTYAMESSKRHFNLTGDLEPRTCDSQIIAFSASAKYLGLPRERAFIGKAVTSVGGKSRATPA